MKQRYFKASILLSWLFFLSAYVNGIIIRNYSGHNTLRIQCAVDSVESLANVPGKQYTDPLIKIPAKVVISDLTLEHGQTYEFFVNENTSYYLAIAAYAATRSEQVKIQITNKTEIWVQDAGKEGIAIIRNVEIVNNTPYNALVDLSYSVDRSGFGYEKQEEQPGDTNFMSGSDTIVSTLAIQRFLLTNTKDSKIIGPSDSGLMRYTSFIFPLRFMAGYIPHRCILNAKLSDSENKLAMQLDTWTGQGLFPFSGNKTLLGISMPEKAVHEVTDRQSLFIFYTRLGYAKEALHPPLKTVAPYIRIKNIVEALT